MKESKRSAIVRDAALLAGILGLYLASAGIVELAISPFPADPDYIYLANGLDILVLQTPSYFDHPGTPVQIAAAFITGVTWLVTLPLHGWAQKMDDVLLHSQFYLAVISGFFTVAIASAMGFFAWTFRTRSGALVPALIGLFILAASDPFYFGFRRVAPEPVLLAGTLFLAGLLVRLAFEEAPAKRRNTVLVGITLALCVTAKVTSIPLLLSVFALPEKRERIIAIVTFAGAALLFLAPMYPHLWQMIAQNWHILTHRGDYGSGAAGLPLLGDYWRNALELCSAVPELFCAPLIFLLVVIVTRLMGRRLPYSFERTLLVCSSVIIAALLLVAKQPRPYYLVPELAFLCLGASLAAFLLLRRLTPSPFAIVFMSVLAFDAFHVQVTRAAAEAAEWKDDQRLLDRAAHDGCLTVPRYAIDMTQWDLYFGNYFAGGIFGGRLQKLYPNFVTYNEGYGRFSTFISLLSPKEAIAKFGHAKCVQLIGPLSWKDQAIIPAKALNLIDRSQFHALYGLQAEWLSSMTNSPDNMVQGR